MTRVAPAGQQPGHDSAEARPVSARRYVLVYGPGAQRTGLFDGDQIDIEKIEDVITPADGTLVIKQAAREAAVVRGHQIPARKARVVVYARGAWTKFITGEARPRTPHQEEA